MIYRILIALLLLSGCRTIKKSFSSADSSSATTESNKSKFDREVITEYLVDTLWRTRLDTLYKTVAVPDYHVIEKPYIIRQTVRESGESESKKQQEVVTSEVEKEKDAKVPVLLQWAGFMIAAAVLLLAIALIIKQFK